MPTFEGEKVEEGGQGRVFAGDLVESGEQQADSDSLTFLNRGIAQLFGMPGDLMNAANRYIADPAYRAVGLPETQELPIGSRAIESGMRSVGVPVPQEGEQADEFGDVAAREIGAGIASLLPFGGAARGAQQAVQAGRGGTITRGMAEAGETMTRRPGMTSAAEATSIAGAGAGAGAGYEAGKGTDNEQALEVLGALAGGMSPAVLATAPSTVKLAARGARAAVDPFTREGATFRAAKRAQQLAADPDAAAKRLADDEILPEARGVVPPAQRTDESRLVGLQRALTDDDAGLDETLTARSAQAEQTAREAGENIGGAPAESAREFLSRRRSGAVQRFQERAGKAVNRAQERLSRLDADASPEAQSRIVRDELENTLKAAQTEETRLWNQVPRDTRVLSRETRRAFDEIEASQGKLSDPDDVPQIIREGMDKVAGRENVGELQTLRSRILREIRGERAKDAPNRNKIANLERMQGAILDDMSRAGPRRKGGEKLQEALSFSRVLNERFRQGPVGRVLGFERRGGPSVAPGETLARTVGRGRESGAEGIDAIRRATGDADDTDAANAAMNRVLRATQTEEGRESVGRFMEANFRQQAVNHDGTVSPAAAEQFLRRNREVLERMPEVRQRVQEAANAQRGAERALKQSDRLNRSIQQKAGSRLALYLDQPPEKAMRRVIESNDPRDAARKLMNTAKKDPSGLAQKGLKDEFVKTLMREAETGDVDGAGRRMISGRRMTRLLENEQAQKVSREFLSGEERKRLKQIANTFARVEAGRDRAPNVGRPMEDLASSILEIPARVLGARAGAAAGGASMAGGLQSAQIFSGRVKQMLRDKFSDKAREVLTDAVQDDELFRRLMTMPTKRQKAKKIQQRLNAWLGAPASEQEPQEREERTE